MIEFYGKLEETYKFLCSISDATDLLPEELSMVIEGSLCYITRYLSQFMADQDDPEDIDQRMEYLLKQKLRDGKHWEHLAQTGIIACTNPNLVAAAAARAYPLFAEDDALKTNALYDYIVALLFGATPIKLNESAPDLSVVKYTTEKREILEMEKPLRQKIPAKEYEALMKRASELENIQARWFGPNNCLAHIFLNTVDPKVVDGMVATYDPKQGMLPCFSSSMISMRLSNHVCSCCNSSMADAKKCARCRQAFYCDVECQKKHWKTHKLTCEPLTKSSSSSS
eukprot:TRINITY_DN3967_c0_g1_i4.p1 TRINITY_DN3967_c0_g1~~TRINITY_DN3967_c0_g1_i4.p1  ORF type:complete len:283 (-),score=29.81 TRINITY_DN3967_c0_g1_i4:63-911(-)